MSAYGCRLPGAVAVHSLVAVAAVDEAGDLSTIGVGRDQARADEPAARSVPRERRITCRRCSRALVLTPVNGPQDGMPDRRRHDAQEVEEALQWAEHQGAAVEIRNDGPIFGRLRWAPGRSEGTSWWILDCPPNPAVVASAIRRAVARQLNTGETEAATAAETEQGLGRSE